MDNLVVQNQLLSRDGDIRSTNRIPNWSWSGIDVSDEEPEGFESWFCSVDGVVPQAASMGWS